MSTPIWGELERLLARWRAGDPAALDLLLARILIPLAVLALILSGTAIAALVTAFLWP